MFYTGQRLTESCKQSELLSIVLLTRYIFNSTQRIVLLIDLIVLSFNHSVIQSLLFLMIVTIDKPFYVSRRFKITN